MKKILSLLLALSLVLALVACGGKDNGGNTGNDTPGNTDVNEPSGGDSTGGELITVGVINNDPNESGYRTANDAAMRATFTEENGYKAT